MVSASLKMCVPHTQRKMVKSLFACFFKNEIQGLISYSGTHIPWWLQYINTKYPLQLDNL
jgi:hypothetical protein